MNLRAVVILTGFAALSREMRNPIIRTVLYHHGFANVYHSAGLAFSVLPGIINSLPGVKKLLIDPVGTLGIIVRKSADLYPTLEDELASQTPVIIVSGDIQEGKTTFLIELITILKERNVKINGFLARGIHDENGRIGYDLEDVISGESHPYIRNINSLNAYRHGKYYFSPDGLDFGKGILNNVRSLNTELAVIDEVGPVELKGKGWAEDIEKLVNIYRVPQLWVVRKPILKKVVRQWNIGEVMVIDISIESVDDVIDEIQSLIKLNPK